MISLLNSFIKLLFIGNRRINSVKLILNSINKMSKKKVDPKREEVAASKLSMKSTVN